MGRIRIPDNITTPEGKRIYLLSKGECMTSSPLFEEAKRLKDKVEVTFVIRGHGGNTKMWGTGPHQKIRK